MIRISKWTIIILTYRCFNVSKNYICVFTICLIITKVWRVAKCFQENDNMLKTRGMFKSYKSGLFKVLCVQDWGLRRWARGKIGYPGNPGELVTHISSSLPQGRTPPQETWTPEGSALEADNWPRGEQSAGGKMKEWENASLTLTPLTFLRRLNGRM